MKSIDLSCSTIVIANEVKEELAKLPVEEQQKLIMENVEVIKTSDNIEMLTLLLEVEDGKLISKKNSSNEVKVSFADKQRKILVENINKKEFKDSMQNQMKEAIKIQKDIIKKTGYTPISWFDGRIKVLPITKFEIITLVLTAYNIVLSMFSIGMVDIANPATLWAVKLSMISNCISAYLIGKCISIESIKNRRNGESA